MKRIIKCEMCGKEVNVTGNKQKFCPSCSAINFKMIKKKYRESHLEQEKQQKKRYRETHKEEINAYMKKWSKNNRDKRRSICNKSSKKLYDKRRIQVLEYYGGRPPKCACCGENHIEFLGIDHIKGGGVKHRKKIKSKYNNIYSFLVRNNFPKGFRVLCYNCNLSRGFYGYCPHTKEKNT